MAIIKQLFTRKYFWIVVLVAVPLYFLFLARPVQMLELNFQRWRWQQFGPANYDASFHRLALWYGGSPPYRASISVRDHQLVSAYNIDREQEMNAEMIEADSYLQIEQLFKAIEHALERNANSVFVWYNFRYGYPSYINLDYKRNTADDGLTIEVESFQVVP
jgi:hypothetical protein